MKSIVILKTGSIQFIVKSWPDSQQVVGLTAMLNLALLCRAGAKRLVQGGTCRQTIFTSVLFTNALFKAWFILACLLRLVYIRLKKSNGYTVYSLGFQNAPIVIIINNCCLKCILYHLLFWNKHYNNQTEKVLKICFWAIQKQHQ